MLSKIQIFAFIIFYIAHELSTLDLETAQMQLFSARSQSIQFDAFFGKEY